MAEHSTDGYAVAGQPEGSARSSGCSIFVGFILLMVGAASNGSRWGAR